MCFMFHVLSEAAFLVGVTGISLVFGFGHALAMAKKQDPSMFIKVNDG